MSFLARFKTPNTIITPGRPRILPYSLLVRSCWGSYVVGYLSSIGERKCDEKASGLKRIISPLRRAEIAEIEVMHEH